MGCCGEEDEDGLHHILLHDPNANSNPSAESLESSSAAAAVLSPMNSNFAALGTRDLLRSMLELLPPSDLARAACVCRLWREVATEREVLERGFRKPWKVRRLLGSPSSAGFWRYPGLDRFAISHRLLRGDTVAGLALKYSVQHYENPQYLRYTPRHQNQKTQELVDQRSHHTFNEFNKLKEQQSQSSGAEGISSGSLSRPSDFMLWTKTVGGKKKDRTYGLGAQGYAFEAQSSYTSSSDYTGQTVQDVLRKQEELMTRMCQMETQM